MEKEIQQIETALVILAEAIESGEWQGIQNNVREILGWEPLK